MTRRALVIGGTGPTGPFVVEGLAERGFDVTILHGGQHEYNFAVPGIRHIHEDPHFADSLQRGLGVESFDVTVAQYGRLRVVADAMRGRTGQLIAIGGATGIYAPEDDPRWGGTGRPASFPDDTDVYVADEGPDGIHKIGRRMVQAMEALFAGHADGAYRATYLGYPLNYGPRTPGPYDWTVVRRILDGRRRVVIADHGLKMDSRVYTENAATAVLLCVDKAELASGRRYSVADRYTFTMRQRIEFIGRYLGHDVELVDLPYDIAWPCHPFWRHVRGHRLTASERIREELGFVDPVEPDVAMERSIDWLIANRGSLEGEFERQVGDVFDYDAEDELIDRWLAIRASMGPVDSPLPTQGHQYRHPKRAGEAWRSGSDDRAVAAADLPLGAAAVPTLNGETSNATA